MITASWVNCQYSHIHSKHFDISMVSGILLTLKITLFAGGSSYLQCEYQLHLTFACFADRSNFSPVISIYFVVIVAGFSVKQTIVLIGVFRNKLVKLIVL